MITTLLSFGFMNRALISGIIVALICPTIGIFLVLRRYALIADTLSHVALAGVAIGLLLGVNPMATAAAASVGSSLVMEKLRRSKRVAGEGALSIFLSGSLAVAVILISFGKGSSVNILNYLFGSIMTVTMTDIYLMAALAVAAVATIAVFYKELVAITFDEESARVAGLPTNFLNSLLIGLSALVVAVSMPVVGVLLVSALMVIPVVAALQWKKDFGKTIVIGQVIALVSVVGGILASFYLGIAAGGAIVLLTIGGLFFSWWWNE